MKISPYRVGIRTCSDYSPFGVELDGRTVSGGYRFGFQNQEKDDELKGEGNSINYSFRINDPRLGRWLSMDRLTHLLVNQSPFCFVVNSPIRTIDLDGNFPIFINGEASEVSKSSSHYWEGIQNQIHFSTEYQMLIKSNGLPKQVSGPKQSQWSGDFLFVNGDRGHFVSTRKEEGSKQAKADADAIWSKLKENMVNEEITEQIQMISHSKGVAFGEAYIETITKEIQSRAKEEGIGFAYNKNSIVEYHIGLAPHQSGSLHANNVGTKSYYITHDWDPLSDDDATGHVLNISSQAPGNHEGLKDSHLPGSFNREFQFILNVVANGGGSDRIKAWYKLYDKNTGSSTEFKKGSENENDDGPEFSPTTN